MMEVIAFLVVFTMMILAAGLAALGIAVAMIYKQKTDEYIEQQLNKRFEGKESY